MGEILHDIITRLSLFNKSMAINVQTNG